jgi:hypothetical protein
VFKVAAIFLVGLFRDKFFVYKATTGMMKGKKNLNWDEEKMD